MIKLQADATKIYASYTNNNFVSGEKVYLPDNADATQWQQFDNIQQAKEYFGIETKMTNEEMLIGLGVKPNEGGK